MSKSKQNIQWLKKAISHNISFFLIIPFVAGISFYFFSSTLDRSTQARLEIVVTDHSKMIESFLLERKSDLELITRADTSQYIMTESAINTICHSLQKRSSSFLTNLMADGPAAASAGPITLNMTGMVYPGPTYLLFMTMATAIASSFAYCLTIRCAAQRHVIRIRLP